MNGTRHPHWLVRKAYDEASIEKMESMLNSACLATVCQSAHCPNLGECFSRGTATFMILGTQCTRNCRFCTVDTGAPSQIDPLEPERIAETVKTLGLKFVVVTSVTRDDLPDGGAAQFAHTLEQVRIHCPGTKIEVLVPDFKGSLASLKTVLNARPDMFNHNIETVPRLYESVRPQAIYRRSLSVLAYATWYRVPVKSGLMLGLGETKKEVHRVLKDLKRVGCTHLTLGQYLAPSDHHFPIDRYVSPEEFQDWETIALEMGFKGVMSGPLVRSSYLAHTMA
ncbi:lipoic acid synthetase [Desulfocicer vacuolatum DSM 3385]|uniref:Lipoyl synthase n=1 Tax=Desulfocicer vacuolatum DSM 3385 TaxID=1121400 RepID=A0A1W2D6N2_9BACT|nr:lipoyl synthase [Desulfocicer vacuolatum]SMC92732.1 lipoic acid synthetase [Desulfocicer vacuolatum DSM 3385]